MTIGGAISDLNNLLKADDIPIYYKPSIKKIIETIEQEPVLDKIRAEIEMYEADCRLQGGTDECEQCNSNVFGSVYRIIDKHRKENADEKKVD